VKRPVASAEQHRWAQRAGYASLGTRVARGRREHAHEPGRWDKRLHRLGRRVVTAATVGAAGATVHTAVNAALLRRPPLAPGPGPELVSVLVPARDEAPRIAACLDALLASRGVDFEVLVLDDQSTDGTDKVVAQVAEHDPRVRLLCGADPPPGWLGKPHACAQLAAAASGTVLVFVDADVIVEPGGLAATVALLRRASLDLVSPYPRQLADGLGPRLVQPLLQWSWLTFLPLRLAEHLRFASLSAANGQLLACDAACYARAGGHAAVRDAVIEDVELARAFKRAGARVALADGTEVATCRMYEGWSDLRHGYTKSLWAAFGSQRGALAVLTLLAWLYVTPPVVALAALLRGRPRAALVPLAGYAAGVAGRAISAQRTGGRAGDAPTHPLSILVLGALTVRSWRAHRTGRLRWKGRTLPRSGRG
jgi:hypothetical protein